MKLKKLISAILVGCMLVSVCGAWSYSAAIGTNDFSVIQGKDLDDRVKTYSENMIFGDVTGDGKINALDSFELKKYIFGLPSNAQRFTMDVDGDGSRNTLDLFKLKLIIKEKSVASDFGNTTVEKQYDADEKILKLSVAEIGNTDAFFDFDLADDLGEYKYVTVVWSGSTKAEIGFVDNYYDTYYSENVVTSSEGAFRYAIAEIPASCKNPGTVEFRYNDAPSAGNALEVDSIILSSTAEGAEASANERLVARNGEPKDFNYITINFDSEGDISKLDISSKTTASYDKDAEAVRMIAPMPGSEYYATLDLESYGISADQYKYIVYTSKVPFGRADGTLAPAGEISFCAGEVTEPTEGYSSMFSNIDTNEYHSNIFDLTNADFWKGDVHSLKINFFKETTSYGFIHYLKSIVFCDSYEAAQAICVDREETHTDVRRLFNYGLYTEGEMRMAYRYYVPYDYNGVKKYPVFTFLHGAGHRGDDGLVQIEAVVPYFFDDLATDVAFDSIVIAPQCPFKYRWVESDWGLGAYYVDDTPESKPMQAYVNILESFGERFTVNKDRYYVSGISMGGYGTWDLLTRHSDMFAAGMPLCGGADRKKADILKDIPIKTVHGTDDPEVPVTGTRRIYNAIVAAGGEKIIFTELEGYAHDVWSVTYSDPSNLDWLYSHKLSDRTE